MNIDHIVLWVTGNGLSTMIDGLRKAGLPE